MIIVGASSNCWKVQTCPKLLLAPVAVSLAVTCVPIVLFICFFIIKPTPLFNAQYLIPIAGMLLGNSLNSNIVALQGFCLVLLESPRVRIWSSNRLGAAPSYAAAPFVRTAIESDVPIYGVYGYDRLSNATRNDDRTNSWRGFANNPGKYQLLIMLAIFVMIMSCSLALALHLSLKTSLTKEGRVLAQIQYSK